MREGELVRKGLLSRLVVLGVIAVAAIAAAVLAPDRASSTSPVANPVLRHALDVELGRAPARAHEPELSSSVLSTLLDQTGALDRRAQRAGFRPGSVEITASAETTAQTGVEMEALVGATVAALTVYDMAKAVDDGMELTEVRLVEKTKAPA